MHIKHITLMAGPAGTFQAGTERDVADSEGRALVDGGYAIEIKLRRPELAVKTVPENATTAEQDAAQHLASHRLATKHARKGKRSSESPDVAHVETPTETVQTSAPTAE